MRWLIILLVLCSCEPQLEVHAPTPIPQSQTVVGFFILEDDYLISNLGEQTLNGTLEAGFDFEDSLIWIKSNEFDFSEWRNLSIAVEGAVMEDLQYYEREDNSNLIYLNQDLANHLNDYPSTPIFFKLNLEM
jgi:hypothetical protein